MVDIHVSSVRIDSSGVARQNIHVSSVRIESSKPVNLEPFQKVQLPAGTWSYTSGPPVTVEGGRSFVTPALAEVSTPQAVSLRAAGTPTSATALANAINPAVPAGALAGDLSVLTVVMKPYWATITTPSGWTKVGEATNGTTATGDDVGSTKVAVFVKESAAVGAIGTLTQANANVMAAVINTYKLDSATGWEITSFSSGGDTSNGANYSATAGAGIAVSSADRVFAATAINSDAGTLSSIAIGGMSGATISDQQTRTNLAITTGNDMRILVQDAAISAGTSSAAPTLTFTNASSSSGTTLFFRLRGNPSTGGVLTLTEAGGAVQQFQVLPHTFFLLQGGEWIGAEMVPDSTTWDTYPTTPVIQKPEFGTLQTVFNSEEYAGGIRWAMLEVKWRDWETVNGTLLGSYTSTVNAQLAAYKAAGFKVTLGLGLHYRPTWYAGLASSTPSMLMKNQAGEIATAFSNLVFSQAARTEAQQYLALIDAAVGLNNFDSIRIASGSKNGEVLYPESTSGTTYQYNWWGFDDAAQGGADLATGMVATPWPGWFPPAAKPGGATNVGLWLDWYVDALVRTVKWQCDYLVSLGFTGDFDILMPGRGVAPSSWTAMHSDANLLTNNSGGGPVGAVWQTVAAGIAAGPYVARTALQSTSVANNLSVAYPALSDLDLAVTSTAANSWTPGRWIAFLADKYGFKKKAENPGFQLGAYSDDDYKDTSDAGLMARWMATVTQPGREFDVAFWAHSGPLHPTNGGATPAIVPFSALAARIAAYRSS